MGSYKRDHGDLIFFDIRDHFGITQCVADISQIPEIDDNSINKIINNAKESENISQNSKKYDLISHISFESVITIEGEVVARSKETINPDIMSGEIEVRIKN